MDANETIEVRVIRPDEWAKVKAIRLEALADTPTAFVTRHDEAAAFPDDVWIDRANKGSQGEEQLTVLALDDGEPVGLAVGLLKAEGSVLVVVSVFIAPVVRGRGIGDKMFRLLEDWGSGSGAVRASLWVEETNGRARSFYRRLGYGLTTDRQWIPNDSGLWEVRLEKALRREP